LLGRSALEPAGWAVARAAGGHRLRNMMPGLRVPRARAFVRSSDAGSLAAKPFSPHLGNSRLANSTSSERSFVPCHLAQSGNSLMHNAYCRRYSSSKVSLMPAPKEIDGSAHEGGTPRPRPQRPGGLSQRPGDYPNGTNYPSGQSIGPIQAGSAAQRGCKRWQRAVGHKSLRCIGQARPTERCPLWSSTSGQRQAQAVSLPR